MGGPWARTWPVPDSGARRSEFRRQAHQAAEWAKIEARVVELLDLSDCSRVVEIRVEQHVTVCQRNYYSTVYYRIILTLDRIILNPRQDHFKCYSALEVQPCGTGLSVHSESNI